jgi:hypothetical protein
MGYVSTRFNVQRPTTASHSSPAAVSNPRRSGTQVDPFCESKGLKQFITS